MSFDEEKNEWQDGPVDENQDTDDEGGWVTTPNYSCSLTDCLEEVLDSVENLGKRIVDLTNSVDSIVISTDVQPNKQTAAKFTCFLTGLFLGIAGCFAGATYYLYLNPRTLVETKVKEIDKNINVILMQKPAAQAPAPPENSKDPAPIQPEK